MVDEYAMDLWKKSKVEMDKAEAEGREPTRDEILRHLEANLLVTFGNQIVWEDETDEDAT